MRVLITGVTGFVGKYLAEHALRKEGIQLWGFRRRQSNFSSIAHIASKIRWVDCDIHDAAKVKKALQKMRPDRIFHLAAQSFVPRSWEAPRETLVDNVISQLNLLEAVRVLRLKSRIQVAGSSEQYGLVVKRDLPVKETQVFRPLSPYAVSKVAQDALAFQYFQSYKMHIVRTRAFNHSGPTRPSMFVDSGFARQMTLIALGRQKPVVSVGNMDNIRDFTDVRDVARAYWMALETCAPGEAYNICSGRGWSIRDILNYLMKVSGVKVKIRVDPARLRPSDVPCLIGDASKFRKATGWKPQIPYEQTLQDLLDYWRVQTIS